METLVKEKILEQFVKEVPRESATIQPINVDIKNVYATRMTNINTMKTNDGNYFIRYGGFVTSSSYNAIEVYSVNSLDNNAAIYVFDNLQIDNHTFFIEKMKQSEDGRFYAVAQYYDGRSSTNYLIIFNNFIQDGYCQINKYYTASNIGTNDSTFYDVTKVKDAGVYFILTESHLIRFEINILEGNKTNIASIVNGGSITEGSYQPQLNVLKDKLIFTKLWQSTDYEYEYTKAILNINEELPGTVTLNRVQYIGVGSDLYVAGANNKPYEAIIPILNGGYIEFNKIDLEGNLLRKANFRRFSSNTSLYAYLEGDFASVTDGNNLYLYYFDNSIYYFNLIEFYSGTFNLYYSQIQTLKQYDMITLIGSASLGTQQSIVSIKNIYSPNTTSLPYYTDMFCLPAYMNLYSNSNNNTSLIFSRDATARFYSGNQVTSTFIVPNYLLNDGNIEKASVYGKTNYLLNSEVEDYQKNRFESLYFNFIYNLNVIDNTNGLNSLNQTGSNRIADTLWKSFIPMFSRLSKARITYEDLSTEIINLNLVSLIGGTATFNYQVSGNIVKIEYLSEDEKTVYSTYRGQITGNHTITQVVKIIPNETATLSGTSIYISDSSNLTFANIQINGNSVQNGTPTPTNPVLIKNAGDAKNLYYLPEAGTSNGITYSINEDGTINLSGTATTAVTFPIFKSIAEAQIENGATYTFSSNQALPSGVEFRAEAYNNSSWLRHLIGGVINSSVSSRTGTANTTKATRIRHLIYIANGTTVNITNLGIQFEKGNTQTSFTPEGKGFINETISNSDNTQSQSFTIPCQQPMRSIGDIRDVFVKENGVWYERHYIASTVLDITKVLVNNSYTNVEYALIPKMNDDIQYDNYNYGTTIFPLFTKGKDMGALPTGGWNSYIQDGYVYNSATKLYYWMSFAKGTGQTAVRQQLDGMIYNYVLSTPTDLLCTQEQIQALESIIRAYTYEPITNINSTDETPAYLNATYYKQL